MTASLFATRLSCLLQTTPAKAAAFSAALFTCLALLSGCESTPEAPAEPRAALPKVRNIRPDLPYRPAKGVLHSSYAYLALDSDLSDAWKLVGDEGLEQKLIDVWKANGVRIGTMDLAHASRFMEVLPGNYGVIQQSQGVGDDPVVLETTPWTGQKFDLEYKPTSSTSETLNLPDGQTRLILDFQVTEQGATLRLVPQHHWYEVTISTRTPQEKLLDGKLFAELAMAAKLTPEQVLVLAYEPPPKPKKPDKPAVEEEPVANQPEQAAPADAVTSPHPAIPEVPPPPSPAATDAIVSPEKAPLPTLGTMMLTGERGGRRLQIVVMLYVPPQGESKPPVPEIRPESKSP